MKATIIAILLLMNSSAFAAGTASTGGGGALIPRPQEISFPPAYGTYKNAATQGFASEVELKIESDQRATWRLALGKQSSLELAFTFNAYPDGSLRGEAMVEGRCPAEIRIVSLQWPNQAAGKSVKVQIPFWLGDYLYTPEKYDFRCELAANAPEHQGLAPTGSFYEFTHSSKQRGVTRRGGELCCSGGKTPDGICDPGC